MVFYYRCHVIAALEDTEDRMAECAVFLKDSGCDSEPQQVDLKRNSIF